MIITLFYIQLTKHLEYDSSSITFMVLLESNWGLLWKT